MSEHLTDKEQSKILYYFLNNYYPAPRYIGEILTQPGENEWLKIFIEDIVKQGRTGDHFEDKEGFSLNMRALRNAWYHETSLIEPENTKNRMKFPAWKIIQFYYSIFCSIASLVRTYYTQPRISHNSTLKLYSSITKMHKLKKYFNTPINVYLDKTEKIPEYIKKWPYFSPSRVNAIEAALVETKKSIDNPPDYITLVHFLKRLREWVNYVDGYIFIRLYGDKIKNDLDKHLINICSAFLAQTEIVLIKLYTVDTLRFQYDYYTNNIEKYLGIRDSSLDERFNIYDSIL